MLFLVLPLFFLLVWLVTTIVITPGKTANILETLGKPHTDARMPGLSFKAPWPFTLRVGRVNLQLREAKPIVDVKTRDNSFMSLPVSVQFKAIDSPKGAVKAFYELEDAEGQIVSYVLNSVRQAASRLSMEDLYVNRDSIESDVTEALRVRFEGFGYEIANVLVDEPVPSDEVKQAFNRVIASQREKEAASNLAEAKRIELVGIAEAERESKRLQGLGLAEMREAIANGMKESMETLVSAGMTNEAALSLIMDTNRLDTITTAAEHKNLVLMDVQSGADTLSKTISAVKATESKAAGWS